MTQQFALKGTKWNGQAVYYTGRAGEGWVDKDKAQAFPYSAARAEARCLQFNSTSAMHGYTFIPEAV